jgi:prephenate dehydrogenase
VPPDVVADVIERELRAYPRAVVTDVASVKLEPLQQLRRAASTSRTTSARTRSQVASAAERSPRAPTSSSAGRGSCAATARPRHPISRSSRARARPRRDPDRDDARGARPRGRARLARAAARGILLAGRFVDAPDDSLRLAGQGVRDTTRIAASAPELWVQILGANAAPVVDVLDALAADLRAVADALRAPEAPARVAPSPTRSAAATTASSGCPASTARTAGSSLVVMVDDTPGQLGRLFGELGELGVNVEDLRLEHSPGAQFGLAEISVDPTSSAAPRRASKSAAGRLRACPHDRHDRDRRARRIGQVERVQEAARPRLRLPRHRRRLPCARLARAGARGASTRRRGGRAGRGPTSRTPSRSTPTTTGCASATPTSPTRSASRASPPP